jgi:TPR repeat protein
VLRSKTIHSITCYFYCAVGGYKLLAEIYNTMSDEGDDAKEAEHSMSDKMKNLNIKCTEIDTCANCGKEGSNLNDCNKCKSEKYCNAACKKKHRSKHKKKCERRVAELHNEALFKQPPPPADCPICMLTLPSLDTGSKYKMCCGKMICSGCIHAVEMRDNGVGLCPFCRTPTPTSEEEMIEMYKKRVEVGDAEAIFGLGCCYSEGLYGMTRDRAKALELWQQAGELGCAEAYGNIGNVYHLGSDVERDEKKATHNYELAAMRGHVSARFNLGNAEARAGNWDKALKHFMIAAGSGDNDSVKNIQHLYKLGHATKDEYSNALRAYQSYLDEIRSEQRDKAAAFSDQYKYVE